MELRNPTTAKWKSIDAYVQRDRQENAWLWIYDRPSYDAFHDMCKEDIKKENYLHTRMD